MVGEAWFDGETTREDEEVDGVRECVAEGAGMVEDEVEGREEASERRDGSRGAGAGVISCSGSSESVAVLL